MRMVPVAYRRMRDYGRTLGADPVLVSDGAGWILDEVARRIAANLPSSLRPAVVSSVPPWTRGKIIHFVNRYGALEGTTAERLSKRNRLVVSWFHGDSSEDSQPALQSLAERFSSLIAHVDVVHISASIYRPVVERLGASPDRVMLVPLGVDTREFDLVRSDPREAKRRLGLLPDAVCIGSFQRDGDVAPKLVKGPDVFVEVASRLRERVSGLMVLLTGPGRGWIRRELDSRGIPYRYFGTVPEAERQMYFHACDIYMITSREEGGPAALLESMACGVPVVATRTGMCPDVISDGVDGSLDDVGDVEGLVYRAARVLSDASLRREQGRRARETALRYDWRRVGPAYAAIYRR